MEIREMGEMREMRAVGMRDCRGALTARPDCVSRGGSIGKTRGADAAVHLARLDIVKRAQSDVRARSACVSG